MNDLNPYRIFVKFQDGRIKDLYTIYSKDLIEANKKAVIDLVREKEVYNFTIYKVELLVFNPKLI